MSIERAPLLEALVADVFADLELPTPTVAAAWGPLPETPHPLPPSFEADTATMSLRRRLGFGAGRAAADRARALLGLPPTPIPIGRGGAPVWPIGTTGSISHTDALVCAIVIVDLEPHPKPAERLGSIGIGVDLERCGRVGDDLVSSIMTRRERQAWEAFGPRAAEQGATATFSLKEALYKAQYPLTESWLGFEHVEVEPRHFEPRHFESRHFESRHFEPSTYRVVFDETADSPLDPVVRRPLLGRGMLLEDHVVSVVALQTGITQTGGVQNGQSA